MEVRGCSREVEIGGLGQEAQELKELFPRFHHSRESAENSAKQKVYNSYNLREGGFAKLVLKPATDFAWCPDRPLGQMPKPKPRGGPVRRLSSPAIASVPRFVKHEVQKDESETRVMSRGVIPGTPCESPNSNLTVRSCLHLTNLL